MAEKIGFFRDDRREATAALEDQVLRKRMLRRDDRG
jgi:hypothetical protein